MFGVACHWADPWLIATGTRTGNRHYRAGAQSDDALLVTRCGPHVLLAVADGAGDARATRSSEGAHRAVAVAAAEANRSYPVVGLDTQLLMDALAAAHVDLTSRAHAENADPAIYATTLALVLLAGDRILAARIGDGSLYTWDGRRLTRFCGAPLPDTSTPMLVQPDWRSWVATADEERAFFQGVALCSDGADDFFLDEQRSRRVLTPAMFDGIAKHCDTYGPTAAMNFAIQMLNDQGWAQKTHDDRSLILAFKPNSIQAKPPCPTQT